MKNQLGLMKAYLDLTNLKKRMPSNAHSVKEKYVREYNSILDLLAQASGYNLDSFRVPESEIGEKVQSFTLSFDEGNTGYTSPEAELLTKQLQASMGVKLDDEGYTYPNSEIHQEDSKSYTRPTPGLYCRRAVLMRKLGPILTFFTVTSIQGKPHVDFELPNK